PLVGGAMIGRTRLIDNVMVVSREPFILLRLLNSTSTGTEGVFMGAISQKGAEFLIRSRLADAEAGDVDALFELGVTYSTGRGGIAVDLIEAHKWFNLAALSGCTRGQECRAEIAVEMPARELAEG